MPITASAATRTWLQEHGMGGYLKVIDAPAHPDAQKTSKEVCPEAITNRVIRAALELHKGGAHDADIPPAAKLKQYFGEYSVSGKAYRTYGGPNKVFGEIARILMEYAFVHTNPTSMPQNKAALIISAYEGQQIDWGVITGEGLRAAIASYRSGKKMLSVVSHFLTVLFPPSTLPSPRTITSPPPRRQREQVLAISNEAWEEPTPPSPPAAAQPPASEPSPPRSQHKRAILASCQEWDEETTTEAPTDDVTIRPPTARPPAQPTTEPIPQPTTIPIQETTTQPQTTTEPNQRPITQKAAAPQAQKRKQTEVSTAPTSQVQKRKRPEVSTPPTSPAQKRKQPEVSAPPVKDNQKPPPSKKRKLTRTPSEDQEAAENAQAIVVGEGSLALGPVTASLNQGRIEHGQTTQISEDEVLGYRDLPAEAYEFSALLRFGTTYELVDFLARAQIQAATRMAEEHAEIKMIQKALLGETEHEEDRAAQDRALQKIGRKKQSKHQALLMPVPELNTALVEVYRDLDHTTRAAKDMARKLKAAQQQAKSATELWQVAERKLAAWEQNHPEALTNEALPAPPLVSMLEAATATDNIPPTTAHTPTEPQPTVEACGTNEPVQPNDTTVDPSFRLTHEAATQTGPPLRDYRAELRDEQRRTDRHDRQHQEEMARQKEEASQRIADIIAKADWKIREQHEALAHLHAQAETRETEMTRQLEEYRVALADKEQTIYELQTSLDGALDWNRRREETNSQREAALNEEIEELRRQRDNFKEMANESFSKCELLKELHDKLAEELNSLHEKETEAVERVRAECKKDWLEATAELTKHYEQSIELITAEAKNDKSSYALLHTRLQAEVNELKAALELARAQPRVDATRMQILIDEHRNLLNRRVEEAFQRAGEEWAAQAAELHVLRADAENRRKEGRGFFKMDEASVQNLRDDLTEDYLSLVKSHTAAIEQLLEDFNDDQMGFRLEAEALEQENLATPPTSPPSATEQTVALPSEGLTTTAQEVTTTTTNEEEVAPTEPASEVSTSTPPMNITVAPATDAPTETATPTQDKPDHPTTAPDPENILDILIEDCDED